MTETNSSDVYKVFFYVPNLIGYIRVILSSLFFYYALTDYQTSVVCYSLSFICDYFDGFFARLCNQCSNFGAVLDMVTDRCSTAGLLLVLSHLYPEYMQLFLFLLVLDFGSHWYHMYSAKSHHKSIDSNKNWILRIYYGCYPFFAYCCVGAETAYIVLYVLKFRPDLALELGNTTITLAQVLHYGLIPGCVLKNIANIAQLCAACYSIAEQDVKTKQN